MFEAFLRSHHCLLCEIHRRRGHHLLGSGVPDQIPGFSMFFITFALQSKLFSALSDSISFAVIVLVQLRCGW